MSYMSTLEAKGRNSFAVNILNSLRHKLLAKASDFNDKDASVILDSLAMGDKNEVESKYFQYSLFGLANYNKAAAVELHDVIIKTLDSLPEDLLQNNPLNLLKQYLENKKYNEELALNELEKDDMIAFINRLIDNFYSQNMLQANLDFPQFKGL